MKPDCFGASDRLEIAQSGNKNLGSVQLAESRTQSTFALCLESEGRANHSLPRKVRGIFESGQGMRRTMREKM